MHQTLDANPLSYSVSLIHETLRLQLYQVNPTTLFSFISHLANTFKP